MEKPKEDSQEIIILSPKERVDYYAKLYQKQKNDNTNNINNNNWNNLRQDVSNKS
jgi:hypothetical protein